MLEKQPIPRPITSAEKPLFRISLVDGSLYQYGHLAYTLFPDGSMLVVKARNAENGVTEYEGVRTLSPEEAEKIQKELKFQQIPPSTQSYKIDQSLDLHTGYY